MSREKITLTGNILETQNCRYNPCHNPYGNEACVLQLVNVLANESLVRTRQYRHFVNILPSIKK